MGGDLSFCRGVHWIAGPLSVPCVSRGHYNAQSNSFSKINIFSLIPLIHISLTQECFLLYFALSPANHTQNALKLTGQCTPINDQDCDNLGWIHFTHVSSA